MCWRNEPAALPGGLSETHDPGEMSCGQRSP